ncbi:hypothetical protein QNI19_32700 [Cytophagaceae bacterium DM2B3-1]|uniref:Leucine-rich repeat domain-containing protein n=1 Tax=Xanthocytophaga flava TaxID=3048013 RepID=A0ABT7CVE4_9BACT|nr:hypothetical protein [Xanthocytophaga flavus]MDJ1473297.1 hypothetical protein [Xanthocytophaga flavus]MDJ1497746.1 hypothetical protein [Xanthocytophaga flavus]
MKNIKIISVSRFLTICSLLVISISCSSKKQNAIITIARINQMKDSIQRKAKPTLPIKRNVEADTCDLCTDWKTALACKKYVTTLMVRENLSLSQLKMIKTLTHLEYLSLEEIKNLNLKVLIKSLSKLKKLKEIHIAECNIRSLPENIYTLKRLKELRITDSCLTYVSPTIQLPDSLETLSIGKGISTLVFNQSYQNLKVLDLSNNRHYASIDKSISYLKNLSELNLQYTPILYIPHEMEQLSNLKLLRLGATYLVPNAQDRLRKFRLANPICEIYLDIPMTIE